MGNNSSIAGSLIHSINHECKYSVDGCTVKKLLGEITEHEENCLYRKITCNWCDKEVVVTEMAGHDDTCFRIKANGTTAIYTVDDGDWNGDDAYFPLHLSQRPAILSSEDKEFFVIVSPVEERKMFIFYTVMLGTKDQRSKYKVKYFLQEPKMKEMMFVTFSDVLPLDIMFDQDSIMNSDEGFGMVTDKVMQRFLVIDKKLMSRFDGISFRVKIEITKW